MNAPKHTAGQVKDVPCAHCGGSIVRREREYPSDWAMRKFCSKRCAARSAKRVGPRPPVAGRLEEVKFLLIECGESPAMVSRRLGLKPGALARWLDRHGQGDLASPFYLVHRRERIEQHERGAAA